MTPEKLTPEQREASWALLATAIARLPGLLQDCHAAAVRAHRLSGQLQEALELPYAPIPALARGGWLEQINKAFSLIKDCDALASGLRNDEARQKGGGGE